MNHGEIAIFAPGPGRDFGERVCAHLGFPLSPHEEREFEDGEQKIRPLVSVRGKDVFVVQSLYGDERQSVNDKLCRLLFFLGALRDASAERITAVIPYLCYARKDLISSGTTLARAAERCRARGATKIYAAATHGVFTDKASQALSNPALEKVIITNTIPPFRLDPDFARNKLVALDASRLFAEAIRRIHSGGSIVELL